MDSIRLMGMEFYGHHGCLPAERAQGQRFIVDVVLTLPLQQAGRTDDLAATVNYAAVFQDVRAIVEGEPVNLLETVAERIAARLLARYAPVQTVTVTVHKPGAPIAGTFRDAAVEITRQRTLTLADVPVDVPIVEADGQSRKRGDC